jgi:alpha-ketoglutarate-dependent taurine dioxygenase
MKIMLSPNGWTTTISDVDINNLTKHEIDIIGCLVGTQSLVVIKNQQHLSVRDDVSFLRRFGEPDINSPEVKNVVIDDSDRILRRVTGKKDANGKRTGLFGAKEVLPWHANPVEDPNRKSVVYLRAIAGTAGSITSFTNHACAWANSIDHELKTYLIEKNFHTIHEHDAGNHYVAQTMMDLYGTVSRPTMYKLDQMPTLIYKNKFDTQALYFSWGQFTKFQELDLVMSKLLAYRLSYLILNDPKNIYEHLWEDGDIILSDQWLGLHKRHAFDAIEDRLLHRAVVEYTNIDVGKKQQALQLIH